MSTESARLLRGAVCAAPMVLACSGTAVAAAEASLQLLWSDQHGVFRDKLVSRGYKTMEREVSAILDDAGVDITWSALTEDAPHRDAIVIVVTPVEPTDWGLPKGTLGAVMGNEGPVTCIYVFYPAVSRLLGVGRPRSARDFHELGQAVGRVAAHELVHALTPEVPHTREGLMMAHLTRDALSRGQLRLSAGNAGAFNGALTLRDRRR